MKLQIYLSKVPKKSGFGIKTIVWCRKLQEFSNDLSEHHFCDNTQAKLNLITSKGDY